MKKNLSRVIPFGMIPLVFAGCEAKKEETPPNIVFILADDVALAHLCCYGGVIPTPTLDSLAREGMIFENAYCAAPACTPSRFSLLTGLYPERCESGEFRADNPLGEIANIEWNTSLTGNNFTFHELLDQAGYYTGFVGKFHVGNLDFDKPMHNPAFPTFTNDMRVGTPGMDSLLRVRQHLLDEEVKRLTGANFVAAIQWENPDEKPHPSLQHHNLEWQTKGTVDFMESIPENKPFFLQVNTTALHGPNHHDDLLVDPRITPEGILEDPFRYHPNRASVFERLIKLGLDTSRNVPHHVRHYNAGILYLDDQVKAIIDQLKARGLDKNTLIIFTADHAVEPGKSTCYNAGLKVPFIAVWPGKISSGTRSNTPLHFTDFLPSFAEISGASLPGNYRPDGRSFVPALFQQELPDRVLFFQMGYSRGIIKGDYKYIATRLPSFQVERLKKDPRAIVTHFGNKAAAHGLIAMEYHPGYFDADQLYNLEKDPFEQENLAGIELKILEDMQSTLKEIVETMPYPFPIANKEFEKNPAYQRAIVNTRKMGTGGIPWWDRVLDYPQ